MRHCEYIREAAGSDTAVLFIHGIIGTPRHFDFLTNIVPDKWSVYNILLDGHGGSVRDFSHTSMAKWEKQVSGIIDELAVRYENIIITAHSMGTLFAIDAALTCDKVKYLFLLAAPLKISVKPAALTTAYKVTFDCIPEWDKRTAAAKRVYGVEPDRRLWRYIGWIPRYLELFRKISEINRLLRKLKTPGEAYQSQRDELVSVRAYQLLKEHPAIKAYLLKGSGHYYYDETDTNIIKEAFRHVCGTE